MLGFRKIFFSFREMKERNRLLEDDIDPHHKKSLRTRFNQSQEWEQSS